MEKILSILLISLSCFSIFGCLGEKCITLSKGDKFCVVENGDCKEFRTNDVLHRVDGPAVACENGYKEFWIDGKKVSEEDFDFLAQLFRISKQLETN